MHDFRRASLLLAVFVFFASFASAQTSRGTITGIVTDSSGAAAPGASVELKGKDTGVVRTTSTNESGVYRFDAVDPGVYEVAIKAQGFKTHANRTVTVQAAQTIGVDAQLEVGDNVTIVEVSAEAALLQTEAPVRGGSINSAAAVNLPIFGRNAAMLAIILPGVHEQRQNTAGSSTFSVNGARTRSNNFLLDGTENNDISVAGQAFRVKIPEAVQEVSIQTSNYDAEFGRAGGAVVNTIIRSGTNEVHGWLNYVVDFTNDDALTNTQSVDPVLRARGKMFPGIEQFYNGGVGGPIVRDKTFFFTTWQERRQRSTSQVQRTVLSEPSKGKLRQLYPAGTNPRVDLYLDVTKGVTAQGQFSDIIFGPDPVTGLDRGNLEIGTGFFSYPQKYEERQTLSKGDHHFSERDILSVRYGYEKNANPFFNAQFPGFQTSSFNRYQLASLSETHVFSPVLTNELRVAYNRFVFDSPLDATNPNAQTMPRYQFTPLDEIGVAATYPQGRIANNYVLQDTMSYVRGRHSIRFGFDLLNQRSKQAAPISERGILGYSATARHSAFANFVDDFGGNGNASRDFGTPIYYPEYFRQQYFVQDRWQANADLTLTFGLRYENHGTPINSLRTPAYTGLFNIDPRTGTGPFDQPNRVKRDNNNFSPVVGIAYSPRFDNGVLGMLFGPKRTVFRSGFNMGYDSFFNNIASNAAASAPNLISTSFPSRTSSTAERGEANFSRLLPTTARALTPKDAQGLVTGDLVNPYYVRWSFGIQRELPGQIVLDTAYVGSAGVRLIVTEDFNPTVTPTNLRVLPQGFSSLEQLQAVVPYTLEARLDPLQGGRQIRTNGGHSSYHSLQTQVSRRFANSFGLTAAWTWSKLLDNASEIFVYNNTTFLASLPSAFGGQSAEKGPSLFDRTHKLSIAYQYELPWLRSQRGALGRVLGGWRVAGVTIFETGVPYSASNGADSDGIGGSNRPDVNPAGQARVRAQWSATSPTGYVNPDHFDTAQGRYVAVPIDPKEARYVGLPPYGTAGFTPRTGNAGRNTERLPGLNNWNLNLIKNVRMTERFSTEFRTEMYNVWNHPQYGYYSVSAFTPGEGTIASNVSGSAGGRFMNPTFLEAGSRIIRYQLTLRF
ncbi:MAG TPA: TonB-dependent receptor [Bryobacteraceae bacterium]|nr:TonB-dependent receptor [Bryobacteraceae bacterium]